MSNKKEETSLKDKIFKKIESLSKYEKMLILVMLIYSVISFYKLGNFKSPRTFTNLRENEYVIFEVKDEDKIPTNIMMFVGYDNAYLSTFFADELSDDNSSFTYDTSLTTEYDQVLTWQKLGFNSNKEYHKYIMLSSYWDTTSIGEMVFLDDNDEIVNVEIVEGSKGLTLMDEPDTIQLESDYMNSSYFDEVYYPRAVYEIFSNSYIFEYTHPPLGKIIMYIPIAFFGMSPFTYRFMGNVAGIIMILVMYIIGKDLFKHEKYGLFSAIIMAADGMHFTQTRIGTVDSFLALFCIMAFMFFIKYLQIQDDSNDKKRYLMLALSGISWGCAVATKWNTAFVGVGLGVLFFIDYFKNKKMFINNKLNIKPIQMGCLCFVAFPIIVYLASYLPIYWNPNEVASYDVINASGDKEQEVVSPNSIKGFALYQYSMYQYHSSLGPDKNADYTEHPFASKWYTWPISYKPMWFYFKDYEDGTMRSTIASMANPAIWWLSCVTFIFMLAHTIMNKNKVGMILLIMIALTWLPYARITRDMYIYHYFIVLPYMMLSIVYFVSKMIDWREKFNKLIPILSAIFILMFIYFYPVYSGKIVSTKYIDSTKFLQSWIY